MKKKPTPKKSPLPRSLSVPKMREWCEAKGVNPDSIISDADRMWEWASLSGNLQENVARLDAHFSKLSEKRKICPIVLLLVGSERE